MLQQMTQDRKAITMSTVIPHAHSSTARYWHGFALYSNRRPITDCDDVATARGWLYGRYAEDCALAAEWGCKPVVTPPSQMDDAEVWAMVEDAQDDDERHEQWCIRTGNF